jgi:hypothetical protein
MTNKPERASRQINRITRAATTAVHLARDGAFIRIARAAVRKGQLRVQAMSSGRWITLTSGDAVYTIEGIIYTELLNEKGGNR